MSIKEFFGFGPDTEADVTPEPPKAENPPTPFFDHRLTIDIDYRDGMVMYWIDLDGKPMSTGAAFGYQELSAIIKRKLDDMFLNAQL